MSKVLVICGPTATGKTKFALELAKELNGELISADSRQVYKGHDLETGKDLDLIKSSGIKVWLIDLLNSGEEFSVANWRKMADEAIKNILSRGKLPIVVGGSGLYIRALTENLSSVDVPRDLDLRKELEKKSVSELFNYLKQLNSDKAMSLNDSDRQNPRRLIRAIEIAKTPPSLESREGWGVSYLQIGLTAPKEILIDRIKKRVKKRNLNETFERIEINIMKQQLTWFKKYSKGIWFDVGQKNWRSEAKGRILEWYNNT